MRLASGGAAMLGFDLDVWDFATIGALAVLLLAIGSALMSISAGSPAGADADRERRRDGPHRLA